MTNTPTPTAGDLVTVPREFLDFLQHAPVGSGTCCCGDDMEKHSDPMSCGHSPVDQWDHLLGQWLKQIEALAASPALPVPQSGAGMRENARLQDAMLVLGAYLLEKGEKFRVGEGAELVDAYNAAFSDPETNDAPAMREALENLIAFVKSSNNAEGYCMCGSPMDDRAAHDNHTAVDIGEYHAEQLIQQAQAALSSPAPEGEAAPHHNVMPLVVDDEHDANFWRYEALREHQRAEKAGDALAAATSRNGAATGWTRRDLAEGLATLNGEGYSDDWLEQADHLLAHLSFCASTEMRGCTVCSGDCYSANPPVADCPNAQQTDTAGTMRQAVTIAALKADAVEEDKLLAYWMGAALWEKRRADAAEAGTAAARQALENLAREMRAMLRANPKKDGGLYRQRLTEAETVLAALAPPSVKQEEAGRG